MTHDGCHMSTSGSSMIDSLFLQHPSTFLDKHSVKSMRYVKEQNVWVKKAKGMGIDPDKVALGDEKVSLVGNEHEEEHHEADNPTGASSSIAFDTRSAFEAIVGRFDSFNTRLDSIEHKQDELIAQVQQLQAFQQ